MPASDVLGESDVVHLLNRAAFGPARNDLKQLTGRSRERAVESLLPKPKGSKNGKKPKKVKRVRGPAGKNNSFEDLVKLSAWWLKRMTSRKSRVVEKMVLFWHDHIPSSYDVVESVSLLAEQNGVLRQHAMGSFRDLLVDITRDAAMLEYLDGFRNREGSPNENYGRELMELFSLGAVDVNGIPNYTQTDVVEMARSLTGFRWHDVNKKKRVVVVDFNRRDQGNKTLFAGTSSEATGNLGVLTVGTAPEVFHRSRNVIDILLTHRDSDNRPTAARFMARKLWEWFAYPDPSLALVDELADAFVQGGYVVRDLVAAILKHDEFYSAQARESTAKTPVDFVLQTVGAIGAKADMTEVAESLSPMGMELLNPPGVNGWNHGEAWLSASRFRARMRFAQDVASSRDKRDPYRYKARQVYPKGVEQAPGVVDAMLDRFHVQVPAATRDQLIQYVGANLDPKDSDWVERKFKGLLLLAMTSPEFQVH
jgi:uncharacterized protein (DUF1800 family)